MGAPSAAVVDMWQLLTIQIFLVTAADARNCFAWAVGLTLWLRDRRFFPNFDAAIYASLSGHFVREMHKTIPPSWLPLMRALTRSYVATIASGWE